MQKVYLRKFTYDDVLEYYSIAQDSNDYFPFGYCRNIRDAKGVIVCETQIDIFEISYFIGLEYRRKGYCLETLKLAEQIAKKREMEKIVFLIKKDNLKSINLAKKFGAELKGEHRDCYILHKNI